MGPFRVLGFGFKASESGLGILGGTSKPQICWVEGFWPSVGDLSECLRGGGGGVTP